MIRQLKLQTPRVRELHDLRRLAGGVYFCYIGHHDEILEKPDRPLPCPYLPTYLPTLLMGN